VIGQANIHYRVREKVGMGVVYRAEDAKLDRLEEE
jgi:hypothetical protein